MSLSKGTFLFEPAKRISLPTLDCPKAAVSSEKTFEILTSKADIPPSDGSGSPFPEIASSSAVQKKIVIAVSAVWAAQ